MQIIGAAIASSFHIVVGISLAYSAILLPQLDKERELKADNYLDVSVNEGSWIASVIVLIVPVGAMMGGFIMDSIGRLNTIKLAAIPGAIGWSLIATANNVPMIIVGRLLTGLASGTKLTIANISITCRFGFFF